MFANKKMHLSKPTYSYKSVALFSPKFVLNPNDMAGLLTYDMITYTVIQGFTFSEHYVPMAYKSSPSNTVMAVVPDSNRIPFCFYSANNFSNRIFYIYLIRKHYNIAFCLLQGEISMSFSCT